MAASIWLVRDFRNSKRATAAPVAIKMVPRGPLKSKKSMESWKACSMGTSAILLSEIMVIDGSAKSVDGWGRCLWWLGGIVAAGATTKALDLRAHWSNISIKHSIRHQRPVDFVLEERVMVMWRSMHSWLTAGCGRHAPPLSRGATRWMAKSSQDAGRRSVVVVFSIVEIYKISMISDGQKANVADFAILYGTPTKQAAASLPWGNRSRTTRRTTRHLPPTPFLPRQGSFQLASSIIIIWYQYIGHVSAVGWSKKGARGGENGYAKGALQTTHESTSDAYIMASQLPGLYNNDLNGYVAIQCGYLTRFSTRKSFGIDTPKWEKCRCLARAHHDAGTSMKWFHVTCCWKSATKSITKITDDCNTILFTLLAPQVIGESRVYHPFFRKPVGRLDE